MTDGQNVLPTGYAQIGTGPAANALRGIARMAYGPEHAVTIDDVHEQGFPLPGQQVTLASAAPACPAALPVPTCSEDLVFTVNTWGSVATASPLDVLVDVHTAAVDLGPNLNGRAVRVAGAVTVLPGGACPVAGIPVCHVVLVDGIPVGYVPGAIANTMSVPSSAGSVTGQVIDNLLVARSFA